MIHCPKCNEMLFPVNGKGGEIIPPQGDRLGYCMVCGEVWKIPREIIDYPRKDRLNDILVECSKLRGCYPLIHRTLHEFMMFCETVIYGVNPGLSAIIDAFEREGYDFAVINGLRAKLEEDKRIYAKYRKYYKHGNNELVKLANVFLKYCKQKYRDKDGDVTV